MAKIRTAGLLLSVDRKRTRRRSLKTILRALTVSAGRQEAVTVARAEEEVAFNPIFRRAWERTARE